MVRRLLVVALLAIAVRPGLFAQFQKLSAINPIEDNEFPKTIPGVELSQVRGWFANRYPWVYVPEQTITHPLLSLWKPGNFQSPAEANTECELLDLYGSGADVLEYNVNLQYQDHNIWLTNSNVGRCGTRPFFVLYEHINGTNYIPDSGSKNMNLAYNRQVFKDDVDFLVRNVILPNQRRYLTIKGKAVIYMWSVPQMEGNFASLLAEVRAKYPVAFIGSVNVMYMTSDEDNLRSFKNLDGFMEYATIADTYTEMSKVYESRSREFRQTISAWSNETGRQYFFVPTFQSGYDDSMVIPKRNNPPMYPRNKQELENQAVTIRRGMLDGTYSNVGPFVVWNEIYEGGAVIPFQCLPNVRDTTTKYVGCGTGRVGVVANHFGK